MGINNKEGIYDYASSVSVPENSLDSIAKIIINRFNFAVMTQYNLLIDGGKFKDVLKNCRDQYMGVQSLEDQEIARELRVSPTVNLTASKVDVVKQYIKEMLSGDLPWTIKNTPISTMPTSSSKKLTRKIYDVFLSEGVPEDIEAYISEKKAEEFRLNQELAEKKARKMEVLISDQCYESGWHEALSDFVDDFCTYPFAVLHAPVPTIKSKIKWVGGNPKQVDELQYSIKCISPWDFWFTPDCTTTQNGTGVFIRERWSRLELLKAKNIETYIPENIDKILEKLDKGKCVHRWTNTTYNLCGTNYIDLWVNGGLTVDVLIHYGLLSGAELKKYNVKNVSESDYYECRVTIIGADTIQISVNDNPNALMRPVHTASFYSNGKGIAHSSIPQRMRQLERAYHAVFRYMLRNGANSAIPTTLIEYSSMHSTYKPEQLAEYTPGDVLITDHSMGSKRDAIQQINTPNLMNQYLVCKEAIERDIDKVTNVPNSLHGVAQGSGANRTFRGAALFQSNAIKSIESAIYNIDKGVFIPLGGLFYNYNMLYHKDKSVKGDSQIIVSGIRGIISKEVEKQTSMELLQVMASLGSQLPGVPNIGNIITWVVDRVLRSMGVPEDLLEGQKDQAVQAVQEMMSNDIIGDSEESNNINNDVLSQNNIGS